MRVVFMGTSDFAVPSLMALSHRHDVAAVFTRPDAVSRRGAALVPSPVKQAATSLGLPVYEASTLRDPAHREAIAAMMPDAICVVAYGAILPPGILAVPPHGCINVHASLLPRHRGAAPIERAILNGDAVTGVSIMRMDEGLDTGPVALRVATDTRDDDALTLSARLARIGADALLVVLDDIVHGRATWTPQDHARATYASKIAREDVALTPDLDPLTAVRRIRASSERATARIVLDGSTESVILSATISPRHVDPGVAILDPTGLLLGLHGGSILVTRLKPAGRRPMSGSDFVRGSRLPRVVSWSGA